MAEREGEWTTPHGNVAKFFYRADDTNDSGVITSILTHDEYQIPEGLVGWAADIGSHIGGWAIGVALDNPRATVVAVEAVYENALLLMRNVKLNSLDDRVQVMHRAASSSNHPVTIRYGFEGAEDANVHRWIGNQRMGSDVKHTTQEVPGLRLRRLLRYIGEEPIQLMKIDCEGCEWKFLKGEALRRVKEVVGEFHGDGAYTTETLREMFKDKWELELTEQSTNFGNFRARNLR